MHNTNMPRKLKAIIFDNEWVLVKNDWNRSSEIASEAYGTPVLSGRNFKKALQIPYYPKGRTSNLLAEYSAGRIKGDFFWKRVLQSFSIRTSIKNEDIFKNALRNLTTDVDEDAISLVKKLKETGDYRLLVFSNATPEITEGNTERNGDHYSAFDFCYFSYAIGYRKPEIKAYSFLLKEEGLKGGECLYLDDKEENLTPAKIVGMNVTRHKIGEGKLSDKLGYLLENGK